MAVIRGEWWQQGQDHRPLLKNLGDIDSTDLASCSVTEAKIAGDAITSGKIASDAVVGDHVADGAITSGKLAGGAVLGAIIADCSIGTTHILAGTLNSPLMSTGALMRSIIFETADLGAKASLTSCNYVFKPLLPIYVRRLQMVPLANMTMATCGVNIWTLFACTCQVVSKTLNADIVAGSFNDFGAIDGPSVAACYPLALKVMSTCTDAPAFWYQLDYTSTG